MHVVLCAGKLTVRVSEVLSLSGEMNEDLSGTLLADQFLCHTVDWLISFYATLLTGSSVFMPHC